MLSRITSENMHHMADNVGLSYFLANEEKYVETRSHRQMKLSEPKAEVENNLWDHLEVVCKSFVLLLLYLKFGDFERCTTILAWEVIVILAFCKFWVPAYDMIQIILLPLQQESL